MPAGRGGLSRVTSNQSPPPKNGNNLSNSSHRSYECPPHPVGAGGGGRKTVGGWGLSPEASAKGDTSNSLVIAKERETLKTLAYDCGNPVLICLRAFARSAFLFTGSPRSFHSLANNSALSNHPVGKPPPLQWRGTWYVPATKQSSPLRRGGTKCRGGLSRVTSHE